MGPPTWLSANERGGVKSISGSLGEGGYAYRRVGRLVCCGNRTLRRSCVGLRHGNGFVPADVTTGGNLRPCMATCGLICLYVSYAVVPWLRANLITYGLYHST